MVERIAWRLEAAKQLWAGGQQALAVDSARALLSDATAALGPTAAATARIFCLVGSWLAASRCFVRPARLCCMRLGCTCVSVHSCRKQSIQWRSCRLQRSPNI